MILDQLTYIFGESTESSTCPSVAHSGHNVSDAEVELRCLALNHKPNQLKLSGHRIGKLGQLKRFKKTDRNFMTDRSFAVAIIGGSQKIKA